jgi:8-oxo-dGTP pyrophosphatase MutT (NUDIX family)
MRPLKRWRSDGATLYERRNPSRGLAEARFLRTMAMSEAEARLSATVVFARDGAAGLEVLMITRNRQVDFASGALVFPGGKASPSDFAPHWTDLAPGDFAPAERAARVAGLREAFEEVGLLHAGKGGAPASPSDCAPVLSQRIALSSDEAAFAGALAAENLTLAVEAMAPFAHWVTPKGMPKRFDTFFYAAIAPDGQVAASDGAEAADAVWIRPADALAEAAARQRTIIFPTRLNLEWVGRFETARSFMAGARARRIVTVQPDIVQEPDGLFLHIPAEAGYATTREPLEGNRP